MYDTGMFDITPPAAALSASQYYLLEVAANSRVSAVNSPTLIASMVLDSCTKAFKRLNSVLLLLLLLKYE